LRLGTFAPLRYRDWLLQVEQSHEPGSGLFPAGGAVPFGRQVAGTLLAQRLFRIGQCQVSHAKRQPQFWQKRV
jgi:hypothetical protein